MKYIYLILVVFSISCGQILFKVTANASKGFHSIFELLFYPAFMTAAMLYASTTFLWVWLLRQFELTEAYPFFALSFTFVPLLSWFVFKEAIDVKYCLGILLISFGIVLSVTR